MRLLKALAAVLAGGLALAFGLALAALAVGAGATLVIATQVETRYPPGGRLVPLRGGRLAVLEAGEGTRAHSDEVVAGSSSKCAAEQNLGGASDCSVIGRGSKGTVVLLHGASASAADPMEGVGRLLAARGFRVLAIDRPGYGWSERLGVTMDDPLGGQAAVITEALERMGVGPTIVLGHSWSGALALRLALDHPERVAGLVLAAPVALPFPERQLPWWARLALEPRLSALLVHTLAVPIGRYYLDGAAHSVFAPQAMPPDYVERSRAPLILRPGPALANIEDLLGLPAALRAQAPRYGGIAKPTAIVAGDADPAVRVQLQAVPLSRAIPNATLVRLPGIGHMVHWVAPEALAEAVEDVARRAAEPAGR